jgi:cephalosporin-C deacetylase-like acetyl esterase
MIKFFRNIEFNSQDVTLRGRLYIPDNQCQKHPVVVMATGFTATINGMTADKYAETFRDSGYAVLLYDHRNLGISDGQPRFELNFWVQARGYIDGIDFLTDQPEIDSERIAVWGASMSAREAFLVGSVDDRVKAIIALVPAFGDDLPVEDKDGSMYTLANETVHCDHIMGLPLTVTEKIPVVSPDQLGTPSKLTELTAYRWFMEHGTRFDSKWENVVSISTIDMPDLFHVGQCAAHLKAPILMVVAKGDEMEGASPTVSGYIYSSISQPKKWVDIDGGHFGLLYHPSEQFDKASQVQVEFLNKHFK